VYDHFGMAFYFQGLALEEAGRLDEAVNALQKADILTGSSSEMLAALGHARAKAGDADGARKVLSTLEERFTRTYGSPALLAQLHLGLGDRERALDLLEVAAEERSVDMIWLAVRPTYRPLRDEPRFQALLTRVGLSR
jgi:tetratricopeptide (TPR) repeat protein